MLRICYMAQIEIKDEWTNVRIKQSLVDEMNDFIKKNPGLKLDNPSQLVVIAVKQFLERGFRG